MTAFLVAAITLFADTPEGTVEAFVKAFNAHDRAALGREIEGALLDGPSLMEFKGTMVAKVAKSTLSGDDAYLEVDLEFDEPGAIPHKGHDTVHLRKGGGGWRIVPMASDLPTIGLVTFLITDNLMMRSARAGARRAACLSNAKQLGIGMIQYSADHDDRFPQDPSRWKAAIMPYVKSEAIFHCSDDSSGAVSYFFEPRLAGRSEVDIASPAETALIVEGSAGKPSFRHDGVCMVAYVDGHARAVSQAELTRARTVSLK